MSSVNLQQTPGSLLRAAREARGYQPSSIAERLCLSVRVITDIEADAYSNFSAEVYAKGHILSYARFLGIDEHQVLESYKEAAAVDPPKERAASAPAATLRPVPVAWFRRGRSKSLIFWLGSAVVLIVLLALLWPLLESLETRSLPSAAQGDVQLAVVGQGKALPVAPHQKAGKSGS